MTFNYLSKATKRFYNKKASTGFTKHFTNILIYIILVPPLPYRVTVIKRKLKILKAE